MNTKPVFLDVDPSIVEKNLTFLEDPEQDEFKKMFNIPEEKRSKLVKPAPGFCIKTREIGSETKIFINICKTDAIPAPKFLTEEQLFAIMNSDEITEYRIPMSIGDLRTDSDKKGEEAKVCDIAINEKYYETVEKSSLFKRFLLTVVFEGLSNKHNIFPTDERILLKNRKAFGTLQVHRIQQRDVQQKMGENSQKSLIEEIQGDTYGKPKPKIEILSDITNDNRIPEYRLFKRHGDPNTFYAEVRLPNIISSRELCLDIGEDRIILESPVKQYLLDIFVPVLIVQERVTSTFNRDTKILTITMQTQV